MPEYDVLVIGGGPAGYQAALAARRRGASVGLVEVGRPGGACVNFACIPTNILLDSSIAYLEARELDVMGIFSAGDRFNLGRAVARKDALVQQVARGVEMMLRTEGIDTLEGRATFSGPREVVVGLREGGTSTIEARAIVIATGSRWEPNPIAGFPAERVVTADAVQRLVAAPASALVLAHTPGEVPFGAEYAVLLAAAGSEVTLATGDADLFTHLDADLRPAAEDGLAALGIRVLQGAKPIGGADRSVRLQTGEGELDVEVELVVVADPRRPSVDGLELSRSGVTATGRIEVDRGCRTNADHIFAAGDITGGAMLTNVASHTGEVAGTNAAGGEAFVRMAAQPRLMHTLPECGWVGIDEASARELGYDVITGVADLAFNARAVALGARTGGVKVIAERELGQVLGVHTVGPGAGEILAVASLAMQAELPLTELAGMVQWHPTIGESLGEAARRALLHDGGGPPLA